MPQVAAERGTDMSRYVGMVGSTKSVRSIAVSDKTKHKKAIRNTTKKGRGKTIIKAKNENNKQKQASVVFGPFTNSTEAIYQGIFDVVNVTV